tara:strand:- start:6336 stop:7448 length:1113 start_codon:yes stop_codon:yes gene_type:complete
MARIFFMPLETVSRDLEYKRFLFEKISKEKDLFIFARPWVLAKLSSFFSKINWIGQNCFEISRITKKSAKQNLRNKKGVLFYIDEEGGFYPKNRSVEILEKRYGAKDLDESDLIYCWGDKQKQILKNIKLNASSIGHPRFRPKNLNLKIDSKENILIMTNMSLFLSSKNFAHQYASEEIYNERLYEDSLEYFKLLLSFIKNSKNKKTIFIRTHPSEDRELYNNIFKNLKNVSILPRESLEKSLSRCEEVFHFNCTTALDAYCFGIKNKNLAEGSFTILEDLTHGENLLSDWLIFPPKIDKLVDDIEKFSAEEQLSLFKKNMIFVFALCFEILFRIKSFFMSDNYQKEKFGLFKSSKKGFFILSMEFFNVK